ncbi:MAG TPA: amidohydrolase family protein [Acidimicrobiia bacterium]|nr:amidohydrolase family protein [Acidimicrobiia bacterium]
MSVPFLLPCRLADPEPAPGRTVLANARVFDGTGADIHDGVSVVIADGYIESIGEGTPGDARVIDLEGRFLMPGLIDCHTHLTINAEPELAEGEEALRPGVVGHIVAAVLRDALRMGITTVREMGAHGDTVFEVRQAARHGALRIPRLLISGRLVSATSPQASHFHDMYREADGPEEMRKAAREQIRRGADFVKIMTTGARSVEWENPGPAQMTREEVAAVVGEVHRLGFKVAAHCEGLEGTRLAIEEGVDTIEHGFYLHQEPELLEELAARKGVLVPTLSFLHDIADRHADEWTPHLVERGVHNVEEAHRTLAAAIDVGVPIAMGYDSAPERLAASELGLLVEAGMSPADALMAATSTAAYALGLDDLIGTVEPGKLADLVVVDGDPVEDVGVLVDAGRIHLVIQSGEPVAGLALEVSLWP